MFSIFVLIFVVVVVVVATCQQCMLKVNLKCTEITSDPYQRDIGDNEQVVEPRERVKCLINTTCQEMEMSFVQISDVKFSELLMIRLIDAN